MSAAATRPVPRALASLALVLAVAALAARGLSSGTGQALEGPGTALFLDTFCALAALAAIGARLTAEQPALVAPTGVLAPLGVFLLLAFVSAFHGSERSAGLHTAFSWASLAALALGACDSARRPGAARALLGAMVAIAVCAAALGVFQYVFEYEELKQQLKTWLELYGSLADPDERRMMEYRVADRVATGPYILPSHLAAALGIASPLALLALVTSMKKRGEAGKRGPLLALACLLSVVVLALGIAFAKSKGATLALGAGLACFLWLSTPETFARRKKTIALAGASLLAIVLAWGTIGYARHPERFGIGLSLQVRLEYWKAAIATGKEHPLTGAGLETFVDEFPAHKVARAEETRHAHQDLLELFSEEGIPGPLDFAWLVLALALSGRRALRTRQEEQEKTAAPVEPGWKGDQSLPPRVAVTVGLMLGAFVLMGFGDNLSASTRPVHLLVVTVGAILLARAFSAALSLDESPRAHALAGAAALAGALVFVVDGFTDFPLRVHGLVATALTLALLAPVLARAPEPGPPRAPVRLLVALVVSALVLAGLFRSFDEIPRDRICEKARADYEEARSLWDRSGHVHEDDLRRIQDLLEKALHAQQGLLDEGQLRPHEVQLLVQTQEIFGRVNRDRRAPRIVIAELEKAVEQWPRSFGLWAELGKRYARLGTLDGPRGAIFAWERSVSLYPTNPHLRLELGSVLAR
ncbi:O-antigen ligase family protein, partial [bacterium]|nr:O-antigen ligase family protein [bacterium]